MMGIGAKRALMSVALAIAVMLTAAVSMSPALSWFGLGQGASMSDADELGRLSDLTLAVHHHVPELEIDDTGPILRAIFVNTRFNNLAASEQKVKARQIARLLLRSYTGRRRFRLVVVQFAAGPFGDRGTSSHAFLRANLR
jgi:hypothetical protein